MHLKKLKKQNSNSDQWFRQKHSQGKLHKRGLIATLTLLNKYFKNSEIVFYDIRACYAYFAVIAKVVFEKGKVIAVEGNPHSL